MEFARVLVRSIVDYLIPSCEHFWFILVSSLVSSLLPLLLVTQPAIIFYDDSGELAFDNGGDKNNNN